MGCVDPEDQRDGIANMVLLSLLANRLAKQYKMREGKYIKELQNKKLDEKSLKQLKKTAKYFNKQKNEAYEYKHMAITNVIASIYVLANTEEEYKDYFSYGFRMDDGDTKNKNGEISNQKKPTFVMDLSGIGQICLHFKNQEMKKVILENAKNTAISILEKKFELGQITEEKLNKITEKLKTDEILPEYKGKLYEYFSAIPLQYLGEKSETAWQAIGGKSKDIERQDLEKLSNECKLNEREIYHFLIKIEAPKRVLMMALGKDENENENENIHTENDIQVLRKQVVQHMLEYQNCKKTLENKQKKENYRSELDITIEK